MSTVQFILGRAGTGKTTHLLRRLRDVTVGDPLGQPVFLIVPDQATLMYERSLACEVLPQGNARVRVVSFTRLGREILARHGQIALPELSPLGRKILLFRSLLRQTDSLTYFGKAHLGLVEPISLLLREFEKADRTSSDLVYLAADLRRDLPQLADKLEDLAKIDADFRATLTSDRLDPARRERLVLEAITHSPLICDAHLFLDDFDRFSPVEKRWLTAMSRCCASITLALSLVNTNFVDSTRQLFAHCKPQADVVLNKPVRFKSPDLGAVENALATTTPGVRHEHAAGVRILTLPDPASMAVAVAREVARLAGSGFRYRDIVILTRDTTHHASIQSALIERSIPYFLDARRPATAHPLVRLTLTLLRLCSGNFPIDAAVDVLKSRLVEGVDAELGERFEQFTLCHRLRGVDLLQHPFDFETAQLDDSADATESQSTLLEPVRARLVGGTSRLRRLLARPDPISVRDLCRTLYELLNYLGVPAAFAADITRASQAQQFDLAQEHQQVWSQLSDVFDTLVELLGDDALPADQARLLIEQSLADLDLAIVPPTLDQVLIGTVERTRTMPSTRVCFVVGLNDGEFPQRALPDVLFSETDRAELLKRGVELDLPVSNRDSELDLAYRALTRASERLYLLRSHVDHTRSKRSPGRFFRLAQEIVGSSISPDDAHPDDSPIDTPGELARRLLTWAKSADPLADLSMTELYEQVIASNSPELSPVRQALRAADYRNNAELAEPLRSQLLGDLPNVTGRQIESYASCAFQHFVRFGLGIRPTLRRAAAIDSHVLNRLYRKAALVLTRLQIESPDRSAFDFTEDQLRRAVDEALRDLTRRMPVSPQRRTRLARDVYEVLKEFADYQKLIANLDKSRPLLSEVYTEHHHPLVITTPAGNRVAVDLPIDRIDLVPSHADGNSPLLRVMSLRTGGVSAPSKTNRDIGVAIELELRLLYLLENAARLQLGDAQPAAALAMRIARKIQKLADDQTLDTLPAPDEVAYGSTSGRKPRGTILDAAAEHLRRDSRGFHALTRSDVVSAEELQKLMTSVRKTVGQMIDHLLSGNIQIAPYLINGKTSPCTNCEFRNVCRFEYPVNTYRLFDSDEKVEADE